ncbi:MAG: transporter [Paenibacillaceae bacterium]|nr:transporter [Paenibacillaceae bacterium]
MNPIYNHSKTAMEVAEIKRCVPWIYYVIFFAVLNESVFNVSTPSIAGEFNLDASGVSWVVTIFFIVFGIGMVIYGKLSDMFSVKKLITIGIVTYCVGSLLGFIWQSSYPAIILARALQGAGGSAIPALVFVMVARFFTSQERGKIFGIITSVASCAVGIGPVLGGYVSNSLHWAYLFLLPLPVLVALPWFRKYLPVEQRGEGSLDVPGTVLLGLTVTLLVLFTSESQWLYLAGAAFALALFIARIRMAKKPFVEPALFANPRYRNALIIGFLLFGSVMSVMFALPLMLFELYGMDTDSIGLLMFPGAASAVIFGKVAGNLTVKRGSHAVVYSGLAFVAISLFLQSSFIGQWVWFIGMALILMYIGFSFVQTALTETVTQILPNPQIGVGMGFFNMTSTISGAVVTAMVAKAMKQNLFAFPFHPLIADPHAWLYANLILFLCFIILGSGLLYFFSFRGKSPQPLSDPA